MADKIKVTTRALSDHPLKELEETFAQRELETNLNILRRNEGIAAPMRIMMEMQAYKKVGRLPFLPSNRLHLDVITGRDETIDFDSFLGTEEFSERLCQPQVMAEKKLNFI